MKGRLGIARRRLRNSGLTGTPIATPAEVVGAHGAMQAQDYGPAKWAIGQRARNVVDADLDRALANGSIVRTHMLRPTWHFARREDIRWLLALTGPRVQKGNASRYRQLGLDHRTLARAEKHITVALEGGKRLTRKELGEVLDRGRTDRTGQRFAFILMHCELEAVICSGGLRGKQHTYALFDERVPRGPRFDREEALAELARRYLSSHGPASVKDFGWWSGLTVADINQALHLLGSEVESRTVGGIVFWSMAADTRRVPSGRGACLLQPFDEFLVGYTQTRFFGDPLAEAARAAWADRNPLRGLVVMDACVYGRWRHVLEKDSVSVEMVTYEDPTPSDLRALEFAADELGRFRGLPARLEVIE
jgi:hypothetical protein